MKIRFQLALSHISLALLVAAAFAFVIIRVLIPATSEANLREAKAAVDGLAEFNLELSETILSELGEEIITLRAQNLAWRLRDRLEGVGVDGYDALRADQEARRIATADIELYGRKVGYFDLLDTDAVAVLHPNKDVEGKNYREWVESYPEMLAMVEAAVGGARITRGEYTFLDAGGAPVRKYAVLAPVEGTRFILVAAVNDEDFYTATHEDIGRAQADKKRRVESGVAEVSARVVGKAERYALWVSLAILLAAAVTALLLARSLSRPVGKLCAAAGRMGDGDFSSKVEVGGCEEVAGLARTFNQLGDSLREYMENLENEIAARQAVEGDLRVARCIQESLLPRNFPPFPDIPALDLHANLIPAKEVAGDFYDFFALGADEIAILVGDVSGKGIPASLFMAVSRTMLKSVCQYTANPADALRKVNESLLAENDACMFVTIFLGYYHYPSGVLTFANAGHPLPFRIGGDGACEPVTGSISPPLGVIAGANYDSDTLVLRGGETIFLYSDGVTEAQGGDGAMFGEDRLVELLAGKPAGTAAETCAKVAAAATKFQKSVLFDDLTVLALKRNA